VCAHARILHSSLLGGAVMALECGRTSRPLQPQRHRHIALQPSSLWHQGNLVITATPVTLGIGLPCFAMALNAGSHLRTAAA